MARQVLDDQVKRLGEDHPDSNTMMCTLAGALEKSGKIDEAIDAYQKAANCGDEKAKEALVRLKKDE